MSNYVPTFADPPFAFDTTAPSSTGFTDTRDLVENKFAITMQTAEEMLERLVGLDGNSGFLGQLNSVIETYSVPGIEAFSVTIPTLSFSTESRPVPDMGVVDTDFPEFDKTTPSLIAIPSVDTSIVTPGAAPADITTSIDWLESVYSSPVFTDLIDRLLADLGSDATGIDPAVEQAIYDRAATRFTLEEDKAQQEIEDYFSATGFDLPTGAVAARLQEQVNARAMRALDLSQKIMADQAELEQRNRQFVLGIIKDIELTLRDFHHKTNDRGLDKSKATAANAIATYAENIRAYIARMEANKIYVETQVEALKAAVEYNKGLVSLFSAEADAYNSVVNAKAKRNEAITDLFKAEVDGYEAETRSIVASRGMTVEEYRLRIQNADMELRKAIAEVDAALKGYESENTLRAKVSADMANIAMQTVASAYGASNASVGMSHSGSVGRSESWGHSESRSVGYSHSQGLSESHSYEHEVL